MAEQEQGNIRQEFNLGRSGLNMDSSVNQIEKGKLTYALNASVENFDGNSVNYQNEPGNELCLEFPENFVLIGEHFIPEQNKHIFFLTNPETGASQIGYMENNDCIYHTYISSLCLNFNVNYPIHKAVHKITNCTTEIYWTDGLNARRYLNLDKIPYITTYANDDICTPIITEELDCNKLKVQPNFSIPEIDIVDVVNGGDLKAGTYQFAIQYSNASGDGYTSYYSVTNPTPIANPQLTTANFDYAVGKSIVVNISNIDITGYYQYFNIAVIKTVNNITSVELVGTYFIDNTTKQFTYTGQNVTQIPLTTADIFEKFPYYEIAQDLTAVRDVLVWDNLTSIDRINYQGIANKIQLQWETYKIPAGESYADALNATNLRSYLRDEVYPFEIVFLLDNGKQTDAFHIPGRAMNYNELSQPDVPNTNPDFIGEGTSAPYWKIYNTASVIGPSLQNPNYNIGNATPHEYGEFAYWESQDETYPCNVDVWGDLAGQKIRHHKFPDVLVSPIFETPTITYSSDGTIFPVMQQSNAVYPIGVKMNVQQVSQLIQQSGLTKEQKDSIVAFKIVRGDRSTNKSIVAKGILRNVGKYNREGTDYYYPNYPYNDLDKDPFLLKENNAYNAECHSFRLNVTLAGSFQYTDCNTGESKSLDMPVGIIDVCSTTTPVVILGDATIKDITAQSYTLSSYYLFPHSFTAFSYTNPATEVAQEVVVNVGQPVTVSSTTVPVRTSGSTRINITANNNINIACYPSNLDGFAITPINDPRYRQVFNSPETSFGQPTLGNILKLESAIFGAGKAHFVKVKKHASYKLISEQAQLDALSSSYKIASITTFDATAMFTAYQAYLQIYINGISRKNFAYSFNSIGSYDYSADIPNGQGIKQRQLELCQYLIPGVQSVGDDHTVNNYNRESSVYIKTAATKPALPFPNKTQSLVNADGSLITDNSRFTVSQKLNCDYPEMQESIKLVSYYGSIKNLNVNQWGQIYSYNTIDTGFQANIQNLANPVAQVETIFGGDTFIGKFAFKTKLPFFIDNRVGAPDDSDIYYDEIGNIAYPQYWYSARSVLSDYKTPNNVTLKNIISVKAHYLDCPNDTTVLENTTTTTSSTTTNINGAVTPSNINYSYDGKMYLFAYGIPYYYVESSINIDLRQAFNNAEGDFYPHVSTGIPDNWLQESVVPIAFDNTYTYNITYSKQNKENFFSHLPVDWIEQLCYTNFPFRAIYSESQQNFVDNRINNWLIYRPVSYFDFPQNYGDLISLDGIQNKAVLARFENKSLLYNTMLTIDTSNPQAAYMGNDKLFQSAPAIDFAETDLGYVGSQNKMLLKIPQGQITVDAKRGQVFLIAGNQATDLSAFGSGMNRFFTDHLAFEILRYFPNADVDNHFTSVGLHGVYDSKYDRVIISKLDYIPQPNYVGKIKYDPATFEYYIENVYGQITQRKIVQLTDITYFCNKSWTLSFSMNTQSWISFHSYIPNFYIAENNFFYSGLNEGCNLEAIAVTEIPSTTTTTTTIDILYCSLFGTATYIPLDCGLAGTAVCEDCTTTTTTTSTTTTIAPGPPVVISTDFSDIINGECYLEPGNYETSRTFDVVFAAPATCDGQVDITFSDATGQTVLFYIGSTGVSYTMTCGCSGYTCPTIDSTVTICY